MRLTAFIFFILTLSSHAFCERSEPLKLSIASTKQEKYWGLMGIDNLKNNEGMLFVGYHKEFIHVWSFNCKIDLTVAFLDDQLQVLSIHLLKAFPMMMDPKRIINSIEDMKKYPPNDPICLFFSSNSVSSPKPSSFILELNTSWWKDNKIQKGDILKKEGNLFFLEKSKQKN
jgi:uncharacterized membrane protein (UPF0127 family)